MIRSLIWDAADELKENSKGAASVGENNQGSAVFLEVKWKNCFQEGVINHIKLW